jgi:antitoxin (DNA-binding transcriptional repressor) of toxin-antitoxin stability system
MKAFSIRQLKSNPSTVLRAAEQDAIALVTSHQQPTALVVALDRLGLPDPAAVRSGLALSLFRSGSISVASAADAVYSLLPPDWQMYKFVSELALVGLLFLLNLRGMNESIHILLPIFLCFFLSLNHQRPAKIRVLQTV